jgi:hypothetical protein
MEAWGYLSKKDAHIHKQIAYISNLSILPIAAPAWTGRIALRRLEAISGKKPLKDRWWRAMIPNPVE